MSLFSECAAKNASLLRIPMRGYEIRAVRGLETAGAVTNPHAGL